MRLTQATFAILDTESTGFDYAAGDRIVEVAVGFYGAVVDGSGVRLASLAPTFSSLVHPGRSIPPSASGVHHLTDRDVAHAPAHDVVQAWLAERVITAAEGVVLVAHNAAHDRAFLPALAERRWLCTYRLAEHLMRSSTTDRKLGTLRYTVPGGAELDLGGLNPHRALADVIVTAHVLEHLLNRYLAAGGVDDLDALCARADAPVLSATLPFGKHRGTPIEDAPPDYIAWMLSSADELNADLRYTLELLSDLRLSKREAA